LELLTMGYSHRQIADARKVGIASVTREIDYAICEQRLDAARETPPLQRGAPGRPEMAAKA
jgi:hypothetical protein